VSGTVRASLILLFGVALTGLVVFVGHVQWFGYFPIVRLHMVLGGLLAPVGGLALAEHLHRTKSGVWGSAAAIVAGGLLAVPTPYVLVLPEEAHDLGPGGWFGVALGRLIDGDMAAAYPAVAGLALLALLVGSGGLTIVGLVSRVQERAASRRTGLGLTIVFAWATFSGALLLVESITTLRPAQILHAFAGSWALALLAVHMLAKRAAVARWPRWAVAVAGVIGLSGFGGALVIKEAVSNKALDSEIVSMPMTGDERRTAAREARFDRAELEGSMSCGTAGCHEQITEAWAGSAHRWSARNAYYRKAVSELLWDDRWDDAVQCAACHDPAVALAGGLTEAYAEAGPPTDSEGVTCLACHRAVSVDRDPPSNGAFSVAVVPSYPGDAAANIALDARAHQRPLVMAEPIYTNELCETCHRLEIGEHSLVLQDATMATDDDQFYCRTCHLRPKGRVTYSHAMAGINADLPDYADSEPADAGALRAGASAARAFAGLRGVVPISEAELGSGFLDVSLRAEGDPLHIVVSTTNEGVGHTFPAGPLDLQQVWLEVRAVDSAGAVLRHDGALVDGRIQGEPARLGGREVDEAGDEIEHHDVLSVVAVVDKRVLREGETVRDRFELTGDGIVWPVEVRVRWLFRRANPDFTAWSGGDVDAWQIAGAQASITGPGGSALQGSERGTTPD
jgi:hypothetical protein